MSTVSDIGRIIDKARDEMIFIGPDHPYYPLIADLVTAVRDAWQQGYDHRRGGGSDSNPYGWNTTAIDGESK
jgi:hypothetical protein